MIIKKETLHEIAKILVGIVTADALTGLWLLATETMPVNYFGVSVSETTIILGILFDIILILFLSYYAWRWNLKQHSEEEHWFHRFIGLIFAIVAIAHVLRLLFGWPLVIGGWSVPYWLSGLGAIITGFLAFFSFYLTRNTK